MKSCTYRVCLIDPLNSSPLVVSEPKALASLLSLMTGVVFDAFLIILILGLREARVIVRVVSILAVVIVLQALVRIVVCLIRGGVHSLGRSIGVWKVASLPAWVLVYICAPVLVFHGLLGSIIYLFRVGLICLIQIVKCFRLLAMWTDFQSMNRVLSQRLI